MVNKTVSIIGCGWLGLPLAEHLLYEGYRVLGSATSAEKVSALEQKGIEAYSLLLNPEPVGKLAPLLQADTLLINIPPKAGKFGDAFHPQQIQALAGAIGQSVIQHIIYVSSTSVYPEVSRTVTEEDVTADEQSAAPALIQAEQMIQSLAAHRTVTILRCGGLMGYDRIPGKYVTGRTVDSGDVPVNYLHRDDGVGLLTAIIEKPIAGTFNAVAPEHPTREAVYRRSCLDFNYPLPIFTQPEQPVPFKVISNQKLLQATSYAFKYPDPVQFLYQR